jgi:hypothetical protein
MNNKKLTRNFTLSDDALIMEQSVTRIGLNILATMLRTSQERVMRRADELGVSLVISDDVHDGVVNTRTLRCTDGLVDPLLERLKQVHGDRARQRRTPSAPLRPLAPSMSGDAAGECLLVGDDV